MAKSPEPRAWRGNAPWLGPRSFSNRSTARVLSPAAIIHLQSVIARLEEATVNESAQVEEEDELKAKGDELASMRWRSRVACTSTRSRSIGVTRRLPGRARDALCSRSG